MIRIKDPKDCCGCTACASICAHDAITMEPDALGFLYPKVNESKCVDCGLCEKVCQFNDNYDHSLNLIKPIAYAARHKDINEIMRSRSGAAFVAISDYILEQGGVVYGAGYKGHFRVVHKRATTKEERDEFRGSKYVQSDLTGVFRQVKEDLKNGLKVLFSGTPCQTSGLNAFIGIKLRQNLFLVDIVCHGVPSPNVWYDNICYIEKKYKQTISSVDFRDKVRFGWASHKESYQTETRLITLNRFTDLFYENIMLRNTCGVCPFTNLRRPSDITLADFWGWENNAPSMNIDNKGISLLLLNTEKGKFCFNYICRDLCVKEVELENCMQPNLKCPSFIHPMRMEFEKDYKDFGFEYVMGKYVKKGLICRLKKECNKLMRKLVRLCHITL